MYYLIGGPLNLVRSKFSCAILPVHLPPHSLLKKRKKKRKRKRRKQSNKFLAQLSFFLSKSLTVKYDEFNLCFSLLSLSTSHMIYSMRL